MDRIVKHSSGCFFTNCLPSITLTSSKVCLRVSLYDFSKEKSLWRVSPWHRTDVDGPGTNSTPDDVHIPHHVLLLQGISTNISSTNVWKPVQRTNGYVIWGLTAASSLCFCPQNWIVTGTNRYLWTSPPGQSISVLLSWCSSIPVAHMSAAAGWWARLPLKARERGLGYIPPPAIPMHVPHAWRTSWRPPDRGPWRTSSCVSQLGQLVEHLSLFSLLLSNCFETLLLLMVQVKEFIML